MTRAVRIVQRNVVVYRHVWRGSLFSSFLQPTLYLMALGFGVGSLIDPRRAAAIAGGAHIVRVHDVRQMRVVTEVVDRILLA